MTENYLQNLFAERIGGKNYGKSNEIYKFEKIKRAKRQFASDFPDRELLDFGIGENDDLASEGTRESLKEEVDKRENRGYADNGILEYKKAAAEFMQREFAVTLDPETEINHCIGSKTAYALLPAAFINPGDYTLMTVPGYPIAGTWTKYLGGKVFPLLLKKENNYFPDLTSIPQEVLEKTKLLVINYPNSPTGTLATVNFYKQVIEFAQKNKIVVVQDAAHSMLSYGEKPISFLSIPGAKEVGIEVHSMSKGFNMIGWRLGFVSGNPLIVKAFSDVKDNSDSGQFIAIQKAAAKALRDPNIPSAIRTKYERRLRKLVETLNKLGFKAKMPGGTYFLYVEAPKATKDITFGTAEEASQFLIRERGICCVPWDEAGPHLRFSVTYQAFSEQEEDALMQKVIDRLQNDRLTF